MQSVVRWLGVVVILLAVAGCYSVRAGKGGGQANWKAPRVVRAEDVAVPAGYRVEAVATGLTFPTDVTFDDSGRVYVIEAGYSYGESWTTPRLLRIESGGRPTPIATGGRNGPWTGVSFGNGAFFVAEGGELEGGRLLRITPDGRTTTVLGNLPTMGDHHTNGARIGPDGWIYIGVGAATNSAVVGEDNAQFGWLKRNPDFHDTPCEDITLTGENFTTKDPLTGNGQKTTGAFSAFGTSTTANQVIRGRVPCNGSVLRVRPEGGTPELIAWGFRNPFGLAFSSDGQLYVTDNAYDDRGSRPVWGTGDLLWKVTKGTWYGWPDFSGNEPLADRYSAPGKPKLKPVLAKHPDTPPKPVAVLGVHASADGFDFAKAAFGYPGQAFVATFGDQAPVTGKVTRPVGFKVVRVDIGNGVIEDFATNRGTTNGPASMLRTGGLERPVTARFDRAGSSLYVVDFGVMLETATRSLPQQNTGVLWRITKEGAR